MSTIFTYQNLPLILVGLFVIFVLFVYGLIKFNKEKRKKIEDSFLEQLELAQQGSSLKSIVREKSASPVQKWNSFWGKSFHKAGWKREFTEPQIGALVFIASITVYLFIALVSRSFGLGIVIILPGYIVLHLVLDKAIKKKQVEFDEQIPAFLSMLKSNIQAGETPERALISAINLTYAPLADELQITKGLIETGTFQTALRELRDRTSSDILRFLCSCIEISSQVGANLEDQIEVIEDLLDGKAKISRQLTVAESKHKPLLIMSVILIPSIFTYTYLVNESTREYWFNSVGSWFALAISFGIFGLGVYLSDKMVKNATKL